MALDLIIPKRMQKDNFIHLSTIIESIKKNQFQLKFKKRTEIDKFP